jgi:hypothetical protein
MDMSSYTFVQGVLLGKQNNNNSLNDPRHRGSRAMMTRCSVYWPNSGLNLTKGDKKCASTDRRREE